MAVNLRRGPVPLGVRDPLLDSLPSSPISETRVERLDDFPHDRVMFSGEWRCRVTDVRARVSLAHDNGIRPERAFTETGYAAIAWCHLFHSRLRETHAAMLRLVDTAGRAPAIAGLRGIIDAGFGDQCLADARRLAASADSDADLLRRLVEHRPYERLYYSRVEDPNDWRPRLYGDSVDGPIAMDRPTTATEIAMRQAAMYGTSIMRTPELQDLQRLRAELMRDLVRDMQFAAMPQMFVDDGTFSRMHRARDPATEAAIARARDTLVSCLNPAQLEQFNATGEFDVVMSRTQGWPRGRYRIRQRRTYTVLHVETGDEYCAVIEDASCPVFDQMLAMKLLLEIEPARFFATANRSARFRPGPLTRAMEDLALFVAGARQDTIRIRRPEPFLGRAAERGAEIAASRGLLNGRGP